MHIFMIGSPATGREVGVYNSSVRFNGSHSIFPVTLSEKENEPKGHRGTPLSSLSGAHRRYASPAWRWPLLSAFLLGIMGNCIRSYLRLACGVLHQIPTLRYDRFFRRSSVRETGECCFSCPLSFLFWPPSLLCPVLVWQGECVLVYCLCGRCLSVHGLLCIRACLCCS